MTNTMNAKSHIYGMTLGDINRLYIGCARLGAEFDRARVMSELENATPCFDRGWLEDGSNQKLEPFEIESYASESEASEALDFWRNYFRSLGFELDGEFNASAGGSVALNRMD